MIGSCRQLCQQLRSGALDPVFQKLYEREELPRQKERYLDLLERLLAGEPDTPVLLVRVPGRTELGGNHTDHNHGTVLAAAVDLDCVGAVAATETGVVDLVSAGYPDRINVDLRDLAPREEERGRPEALIRGVAAGFAVETGGIGGFRGYLQAGFKPGTGLSSSASFAVLVGGIFNFLLAKGRLSAEKLAHLAKDAENHYFGKPCGLMDQMTCAVGTTLAIDFQVPDSPRIERLAMTKKMGGYRLVVIDTGGSHADLTPEYAAIPDEMKAAAAIFGRDVGRGLSPAQVLAAIPAIREGAGDRAALRLLHFVEENQRAIAMAKALAEDNFALYLQLVAQSGASSCMLLQNCVSSRSSHQQGILLGLALSSRYCPEAVSRVHGGGFAGTIQAYVPEEMLSGYSRNMAKVFGADSVIPLRIGRPGLCCLHSGGLTFPAGSNGV